MQHHVGKLEQKLTLANISVFKGTHCILRLLLRRLSGVVVKNVKIQSFFFPFLVYIFSIFSPNLAQKSHHTAQELDSTDKFTLGHHGGVTGTHLDQLLPNTGQHITRISLIITYHQTQFQPSSYTDTLSTVHTITYTLIYIHSLHFTSTYYIIPAA